MKELDFFSLLIEKTNLSFQNIFLENEKRQATDTNPQMTHILALSDKNFKSITISMIQWAVTLKLT